MKKRGLSNVIATILIVLLVLLGIILVWVYLHSSITQSSERVEMQERCYALDTELQSCEYAGLQNYYFVSGLVKHKRGDPTDIRLAFYMEDGSSVVRDLQPIEILEAKKILPPTKLTSVPIYAIVSPIVYSRDESGNLVCPISKRMICNEVTLPGNLCEIPTSLEDINPFILALERQLNYTMQFPDCPINSADFNCDGEVNAYDIDKFVTVIESGWVLCNQSMICDYDPAPGNQSCWDSPESLQYCNTTLCV